MNNLRKATLLLLFATIFYSCKKDCVPTTWYKDIDGDGKGDPKNTVESCEQPESYVSNADDVLDNEPQGKQTAIVPYRGATWCPPCGQYGEETKAYIESNYDKDEAIIISSQSNDLINPSTTNVAYKFGAAFMANAGSSSIPNMFTTGGGYSTDFYPTENSAANAIDIAMGQASSSQSVEMTADVAIGARLDGNTIKVEVKTKFYKDKPQEHFLSVYILEDLVKADQQHSSQGTVEDMNHNHILRKAANETNYLGESLGKSFSNGEIFEKSISIEIEPAWNTANLKVVALIWEGNGVNAINGKVVHLN